MTTRVSVDAHAGWDVRVTQIHRTIEGKEAGRTEIIVKAGTVMSFHVWQMCDLEVRELPFVEQEATPVAEQLTLMQALI